MLDVSVVIPTYREADNLRVLASRLAAAFARQPWTWEMVVVDDASPDATEAVCAELAQSYPLRLIVRRNERGLSSAVIHGMQAARGQVLVCMDADLSHSPEMALELARPFLVDNDPTERRGADIPVCQIVADRNVHPTLETTLEPDFIIGSRYVAGGGTEDGWGLFRWLNSQAATWLARPLVKVRDPMAGFFALRRSDFQAHVHELNPIGYKIGLELMVKCGCTRIVELPIQFANRLHGESKLCLREQWNYLRHLARLYAHKYRELNCVLRFGLVGLSGVAVDLSCLTALLALHVPFAAAAAVAIWIAMTWNFAGNRLWTFGPGGRASLLVQYLQFCASCLLGGAFNWSTRVALTTWVAAFHDQPLSAAVLGVLAGFASNFALCRWFVFRKPGPVPGRQSRAVIEPASAKPPVELQRSSAPALQRTLLCGLISLLFSTAVFSQEAPQSPRQIADAKLPTGAVTPLVRKTRNTPLDVSIQAVEKRLKDDVTYLASDELEGRGVRTKGLELASEFLAREFAAAGLVTANFNGTPYHEFRLHTSGDKGAVQELAVTLPNGDTQTLALGGDYHSLMVSPKGAFRLPMVFVGYGITDQELGYDDYEGVNAAGKAVVVLRHEPFRADDPPPADGQPRKAALVITKIRNAVIHGAAAVILVTDAREFAKQLPPDAPPNEPLPETPEVLLDVEFNTGVGTETLPVVHCRRRAVAEWIRAGSGQRLDDLEQRIEKTQKPASVELTGCSAAARVAVTRAGWTLRNVVGLLPGSGEQKDEALVIGAHYDHLGLGGWGSLAFGVHDTIHNGADDNASGTAVLLEVARQLAASPKPPNRQIVFVAFSAEELGLIGSRRYVQNPLVPLSQTVAMLNLDMVGRLRNERLTVYGTGTAVEWPEWLADAAAPQQLLLVPRPSGYGPSDHASFYERGIPVLHFFTGFHPEYHRPSDDSELLNIGGMRKVTSLLTRLVHEIDASPSRPRMTSVDEASILANLGDAGMSTGRDQEGGPRLGVILDTAEVKEGVRVKQLIKYSPAEQGGLRSGDLILKLDDQPMKSVEEIQKYVSSRQHGQKISVEFDRRGTRRLIELAL